jgi:hypothetical protein
LGAGVDIGLLHVSTYCNYKLVATSIDGGAKGPPVVIVPAFYENFLSFWADHYDGRGVRPWSLILPPCWRFFISPTGEDHTIIGFDGVIYAALVSVTLFGRARSEKWNPLFGKIERKNKNLVEFEWNSE